MDDKTQQQQQQRLCYFCQAPGPQFQESPNTQQHKDEKTQKCSLIWICNNCRGEFKIIKKHFLIFNKNIFRKKQLHNVRLQLLAI